jgi:predicted alpha/beta-fold hydrolase
MDKRPAKDSSLPILVIVGGITANNDPCYIHNILIEAKENGFQGVLINYRSASGVAMTVRDSHKIYPYRALSCTVLHARTT